MQNILTNKIDILIKIIDKEGRCDSLIVTALFKHVRELIEHTGAGPEYPLLNFYCNCLVHVEMDRRLWLAEFFEIINSAFQDNFKECGDALISSISKAFSLIELRHELIDFLSINKIQGNCFARDDVWYAVLVMIVRDLIGKNIKFPSSLKVKVKEIKKRMKDRNMGMQIPNLPYQLKFYVNKNENRTIMWEITFTKGYNYPSGLVFRAPLHIDLQVEVKDDVVSLK